MLTRLKRIFKRKGSKRPNINNNNTTDTYPVIEYTIDEGDLNMAKRIILSHITDEMEQYKIISITNNIDSTYFPKIVLLINKQFIYLYGNDLLDHGFIIDKNNHKYSGCVRILTGAFGEEHSWWNFITCRRRDKKNDRYLKMISRIVN